MAAGINDRFNRVISGTTRPVATTLSAQKVSGATTASVVATTGWDNTTAVHGIMYRTDSSNNKVPGSQIDWKGTFSGTTISNFQVTAGSDDTYAVGTTVELSPTAAWADDLVGGILVEHDQDGTHGDVTANSIVATTGTFTNLTINGTSGADGWSPLGQPLTSITALGNRSYTAVVSGVDTTGVTSVGQRLKLPRTVTAPTQCADLEAGSSQYFNDTTVSGMTFTDDFVVSAWIKLESYPSTFYGIASRYNGTSGWSFDINSSGQVRLIGLNGGSGNNSGVTSYQSVPLNKWVHVSAQLDMSAFTATTTTSYIMFDGKDVPASVARAGSNPTALVQAGDLNIGAQNSLLFFDGKIAQVAIYSAKVTQATILAAMNQTLTGSETSLVSAYTFNGASGINDLSANANNLTAQGSAVATNVDTPFTNPVTGTSVTAGTTNYGIIMAQTFSTNTTYTIQIPEGETLPTTGGIGTVSYSTQKTPYGFPGQRGKWQIMMFNKAQISLGTGTGTYYNINPNLSIPVGDWDVTYDINHEVIRAATSDYAYPQCTLSTSSSAETDSFWITNMVSGVMNGATTGRVQHYRRGYLSLTSATTYYILVSSIQPATSQYVNMCILTADNAYL